MRGELIFHGDQERAEDSDLEIIPVESDQTFETDAKDGEKIEANEE